MGRSHRAKGRAGIVRVCTTCKESFVPRGEFKGRVQKYCGKACWSRRRPPSAKRCRHCARAFTTYERQKVYCRRACRDADYRTRFAGARSHRWRGGTTAAAKIIRTSAAWREWREAVFRRDDYTCVACGARSAKGVKVELHPDHIKPFARFPALRFKVGNGRTLCAACHRKTPTWGSKS